MLRILFIALLLLNLLALAAWQGWLGNAPPRGEPERLSNQIYPERIVLRAELPEPPTLDEIPLDTISPRAADTSDPIETLTPSDPMDAVECLRFNDLDEEQLDELSTLHAGEDIAQRSVETEPADDTWWVHIPAAASRAEAEARARELRNAGVDDLFILREPGPKEHAISLGLFVNENRANQHRERLRTAGIEDVLVSPRSPARYEVELVGPSDVLDSVQVRFATRHPDLRGEACEP